MSEKYYWSRDYPKPSQPKEPQEVIQETLDETEKAESQPKTWGVINKKLCAISGNGDIESLEPESQPKEWENDSRVSMGEEPPEYLINFISNLLQKERDRIDKSYSDFVHKMNTALFRQEKEFKKILNSGRKMYQTGKDDIKREILEWAQENVQNVCDRRTPWNVIDFSDLKEYLSKL